MNYVLLAVSLLVVSAVNAAPPFQVSTNSSGRLSISDNGSGITWDIGVVKDFRVTNSGRSAAVRIAINAGEKGRLLDAALAITPQDAGYVLVPSREGLLIPSDGPVEFSRQFGSSSYEGCHMNMMGFVKQGSALLMTWENPYIVPELTKNKNGLTCTVQARTAPKAIAEALHQSLPQTISVTLTPLGRGDWNTIASAYRKIAESKGFAVTMRAKQSRNAETKKLFGASNVKLWTCLLRRRNEESTKDEEATVCWSFKEAAQIAEHLSRDIGINRCLFTLGGWTEGGYDCRHPDALPANSECGGNESLTDAVKRIKSLGYVACFHDNYQDMYKDAASWNPEFIQKRGDGKPMAGGRWLGGRAYLVCAPKTVELAKRKQNLASVQKLFAPQAYFIDTTYAVGPQECYDPKHPLDFAADIQWKQKLSDYSRKVFGLFGSECGREWAIPHSEFFEGLSGVSGKYYHNLDPATLGATVVPLFEMVYHDCESVYGKYGYSPETSAQYVAHHVLCARTLNYHSFPRHLYWKDQQNTVTEVKAHPSVTSVTPISKSKFQIRYRWQVDANCDGDWRVFVHFGPGQTPIFGNDHSPVRPVASWRKGDIIEEGPFDVAIPEKAGAEPLKIFIGLCRSSGGSERARLPDSNSENRVLVGKLHLKPTIKFERLEPQTIPGDAASFIRADNGWADGLCLTDRFVKNTHEILSPLSELTAHARLTKLEFLTPDRGLRRATYTDKSTRTVATVTVNFGSSDCVVRSDAGGNVTLPTWGFLIESPQYTAFHATSWDGHRYTRPALFTIRQDRSGTRIFHAFGDSTINWHGKELNVVRERNLEK